jgi:SAM-dependent methyltransferase
LKHFWKSIIKPILIKISAKHIIEVGCFLGNNTKNIIKYCKKNNGKVTVIDPDPKFNIAQWKSIHGNHLEVLKALSLNALPLLKDFDAILIDGDHNWHTVYNELKIIENNFQGKKYPVIFLHDVAWPYARRDMYYNPQTIPANYRHPYKRSGVLLNNAKLIQNALNSTCYHAIYENTEKNGILTAVEDFLSESKRNLDFYKLDAYHGIGIIIDKNNHNITEIIDKGKDIIIHELEQERLHSIMRSIGFQ